MKYKSVVILTCLMIVLSAGSIASGQVSAGRPSSDDGGVPVFFDPNLDLGSHEVGPGSLWGDSIYIAGRVHSGTHKFGILVHLLSVPNKPLTVINVGVTDETEGWYKHHDVVVEPDTLHWQTDALNIKAPNLTWSGNQDRMSIATTTPWGALNIDLVSHGPVFKYAGTGYFPLSLNDPNYEYAFPSMSATGKLEVDGKKYDISGDVWLDRQWGVLFDLAKGRWTWFDLNMPNGDKVAIWDLVVNEREEHSWATVMHPDGSTVLAKVMPVANEATEQWTSPDTHQTYPTKWHIVSPSLRADLMVTVTGTKAQALFLPPHYEGTSKFSGTYEGKRVDGLTFVEMTGDYSQPPLNKSK